jgi:hypothetical protein
MKQPKNKPAGDARLRHFVSLIDWRNVTASKLDTARAYVTAAEREFEISTQKLLRAASRLRKQFPDDPRYLSVVLRCLVDLRREL